MNNSKQSIIGRISNILVEKLKVPSEIIIKENYDKPLTGRLFQLRRLDLAYLFFEIEKEFQIRIEAEKILDYEFNTIQGIIGLILYEECIKLC